VGFALGAFAGLAVLAVREARCGRRAMLLWSALAAAIGLSPGLLYVLRNALTNRPVFGVLSGIPHVIVASNFFNEFSYAWEMYLPRVPGMTPYFDGLSTFKDIWFDRSVGLYGFFDTVFPVWVDNVLLVPAVAVALLCARELVVRRAVLRARLAELSVYALITLGVLVMIGASSYTGDAIHHGAAFGEPRYLLPMLPLLGVVLVLAARGAGRRWAPVVGAALVVLVLGLDVFSQLQVIARYYG